MRAILLSGGIDSIAIAYWLRPEIAITIDYGQIPAQAELRASAAVARQLGMAHEVVRVDMRGIGSGDLSGSASLEIAPAREWWPFRNQMLITLAAMKLIGAGVTELIIGTVATDGFHADGTEEFIHRLNSLLEFQEGRMRVSAPSIKMNSVALVQKSGVPAEILGWSHSCHVSSFACGVCRGCCKHYNVTEELGWEPH